MTGASRKTVVCRNGRALQSPAMRRSRISHSILALLLASASLASPPAGAAHAKLGEPVIGFVICERIPVQSDGAWVLIGF